MKMIKSNILDDIVKAAQSVKKVKAPANMYASVMAAIERKRHESIWDKTASFVLRPALIVPGLIIVILLNVWMITAKDSRSVNFAVEDYTSATYVVLNNENVLP